MTPDAARVGDLEPAQAHCLLNLKEPKPALSQKAKGHEAQLPHIPVRPAKLLGIPSLHGLCT